MASAALVRWQAVRLKALSDFEVRQFGGDPLESSLHDECLRSFAMLLSAHFQGFCRDLYSEATQVIVRACHPSLSLIIQAQCNSEIFLNSTNPNFGTIVRDFNRFGLDLRKALDPNPTDFQKKQRKYPELHQLNQWRNYCAHHNDSMPTDAGDFTLERVQAWRTFCDAFAVELSGVVTAHLRSLNLVPYADS